MKTYRFIIYLIIITGLTLSGCNMSVNKSISIDDGETVNIGPKTVNGSIRIGNNCVIKGGSRTVNGSIRVGRNCKVKSLKTVNCGITVGKDTVVDGEIGTVNGSISCDEGVRVMDNISTINGSINCDPGVKVDGDLSNINGKVYLKNTIVNDDIRTYTGNITLLDKSMVEGDIIIKRSRSFTRRFRTLKIKISEGSVVKGDIIVKDRDLKVKVFLIQGGKVEGRIKNAEVVEEETAV